MGNTTDGRRNGSDTGRTRRDRSNLDTGTRSERKIVEYVVQFGPFMSELVEDVNLMIHRGWQPLGGIQVGDPGEGNVRYFQAMVRYG